MREWKWSKDTQCFVAQDFGHPPRQYCLGERMVYVQDGLDTNDICYRGSSVENWGGWHFGYDLKAAIEWVQGAQNPKMGHVRWTTHSSMQERRKGDRRTLA